MSRKVGSTGNNTREGKWLEDSRGRRGEGGRGAGHLTIKAKDRTGPSNLKAKGKGREDLYPQNLHWTNARAMSISPMGGG